MASLNLDEIPTKPILKIGDTLNMEIVRGKFDLSYKSEIDKLNGKFMSNSQVEKYQNTIAGWTLALERWAFGDGKNYLGFATKEMLDNNYLYLSESNYYYKRLLTDEVMEALCNEYADKKMLSASLDYCRMKGQFTATELANTLAQLAALLKSQNIMNDTNIQNSYMKDESILSAGSIIGEGAAALYQALLDALANGGEDMTFKNLSPEGQAAIKQLVIDHNGGRTDWNPMNCWICGQERANRGDLAEHVCKSHKDDSEVAAILARG